MCLNSVVTHHSITHGEVYNCERLDNIFVVNIQKFGNSLEGFDFGNADWNLDCRGFFENMGIVRFYKIASRENGLPN